jgi:DNA-binding NarL/FixJ family response regulator
MTGELPTRECPSPGLGLTRGVITGPAGQLDAHASDHTPFPYACQVPALRVLIADDEVLLRAGVARLLTDAGMDVVAELESADTLIDRVSELRPDVAIVDVQMGPGHTDEGLRGAIKVRQLGLGTAVLVLTHFLEERYPLDLIGEDAAGVGYLLKTRIGDVDSFVESVRRVAAGGSALDPEVVQRMVGRRRRDSPIDRLTPRERQVIALMAEGRSNAGIAAGLDVTQAAVEKHVTAVFQKLSLGDEPYRHRRVMAVLALLRVS